MRYELIEGEPPHPWNSEWFLAKLKDGTYAALYSLPEEYSHQYRTADRTFYTSDWVVAWMQLPESEFVDFKETIINDFGGSSGDVASAISTRTELVINIAYLEQNLELANARIRKLESKLCKAEKKSEIWFHRWELETAVCDKALDARDRLAVVADALAVCCDPDLLDFFMRQSLEQSQRAQRTEAKLRDLVEACKNRDRILRPFPPPSWESQPIASELIEDAEAAYQAALKAAKE